MRKTDSRKDITNVQGRTLERIGLLTPHTGGNLGDAAIQDALIYNIHKRLPQAEIWGFTLYPADTEKRHHIRAYPLTSLSLPFYGKH